MHMPSLMFNCNLMFYQHGKLYWLVDNALMVTSDHGKHS